MGLRSKAADLSRKHGVSEATLYNWKARYGGMDVSEARRLKALEDENAKLKRLALRCAGLVWNLKQRRRVRRRCSSVSRR